MRAYLVIGPREEYITRVTISGHDEDETDIAQAILLALAELDCTIRLSYERDIDHLTSQEDDDAEST